MKNFSMKNFKMAAAATAITAAILSPAAAQAANPPAPIMEDNLIETMKNGNYACSNPDTGASAYTVAIEGTDHYAVFANGENKKVESIQPSQTKAMGRAMSICTGPK